MRRSSLIAALALVLAGGAAAVAQTSGGAVYRYVDPNPFGSGSRVLLPEFASRDNVDLLGHGLSSAEPYVFVGPPRTLRAGESGTTFRVCAPLCDGAFAAGPTAVPQGSRVQMRIETGRALGETRTGTLAGAEAPISFSITTRTQAPTLGSFPDLTDLERSTEVTSAAARMEGYGAVEAVATGPGGPQLSVDGETWANPLTIRSGQSVRVRTTTGREPGSSRTVQVMVEKIRRDWTVAVKAANPNPVAFTFPMAERVAPAARIESTAVRLSGMFGDAPLVVEGSPGATPLVSIDGGAFGPAPATMPENGTIRLSLLAPAAADGSTAYVRVAVGETEAVWNVQTRNERPEAFAFAAAAPAVPSTIVESSIVALTGTDSSSSIAIAGEGAPEWRVAGGTWTPAAGNVPSGSSIQVRLTAAPAEETARVATLTVGGVDAAFEVRTGRSRPNSFSIAASNGETGTDLTSAGVSLNGMTIPGALVLPDGVTASTGGAFARLDSVPAGTTLRLRAAAPAGANGESATHRVSVGGVSADWIVTNHDTTPDAFEIVDLAGEDWGALIASEPVEPTGFTHRTAIGVSGEGSPQVSVAGGTWSTTGTINPGQSFRVRLQASSTPLASRSATVTVGGVSSAFTVTSAGNDQDPDAVDLVASTGVDPSGSLVSDLFTPTGFDAATTVAVSGPGNPQVSVAGRAYAPSSRIRPGENFRVRATTPANYSTTETVTITAGATTGAWAITTRAYDATPDAVAFGDMTGQAGNTAIVSQARTPVGYIDPATLSVDNGEISVDGGAFTASATARPGQSVRLRTTSLDPDGLTKTVTLRTGGTTLSTWRVTTIDTMMDVPWTAQELASVFVSPAVETHRQSSAATVSGFTSAATFSSTCVASVGSNRGVKADLLVNGAHRTDGWTLQPGDQVTLFFVVTNFDLGARGTCHWNIGGRVITAPYVMTATKPEPTHGQPISFSAGLAPGTVYTTEPYYPQGNRTASLVQVNTNGIVEIGGDGNWRPGGQPHRVPAGSYFRVRTTVPASGSIRVTVAQGESLWLQQYFDVTPNAPAANMAALLPAQPFANPYTSDRIATAEVMFTKDGQSHVFMPTSGMNTCVEARVTGSFYFHTLNNQRTAYQDGGTPDWTTRRMICPGEGLHLAAVTPSEVGVTTSGTLTIGNWSQALSYRLDSPSFQSNPAAFAFADVASAEGESRIISSTVIPSGYNVPVRAYVTGDGDPMLSVAGGAWTRDSVRITPGQNLRVSLTSGPEDGTTRRATVRIGTTQTIWSVTTPSLVAAPLVFGAAADVDPSANLVSEQVTIAGLGAGLQANATVTGPGTPTLSVNGGTQRSNALVRNGDRVRLYASAPAGYGAAASVALKVGATTGTWSIATRAEDRIPDPFVVPTLEGRAPGSLVTSAPVTPVGYRDAAAISVTGPEAEISIDGGPWAASGTIEPGESFTVRLRAAATPGTLATATVTVGGVEATWNVATAE